MKILFVGNSITWHPVKEEIGWMHEWGMAASSEDNDFVHIVMNRVREIHPGATHKVAWAVAWEREYWDTVHLVAFKEFINFQPDVIIVKINENVTEARNDEYPYKHYYNKLLEYINPIGSSKLILCTGFWKKGTLDDAVKEIAVENNYPVVELNHLDTDEMKAFDTYGDLPPAGHPGDKGMAAIADAVWYELKKMI